MILVSTPGNKKGYFYDLANKCAECADNGIKVLDIMSEVVFGTRPKPKYFDEHAFQHNANVKLQIYSDYVNEGDLYYNNGILKIA
ncbi:hypothetical protein [Nitrosopumilus sp.]|uniref:hypothetical protein n=1 Tax=Nitrosopumilus sp. TaxID=2024843 RepID=UPI003D0BEFB9